MPEIESYEINLARSLLRFHKLRPPIDIFELAKRYATVEDDFLPADVDGASFYLKRPGTTIILNKARSSKRRRFTLAHELGHVLIPWHRGDIVDDSIDDLGFGQYLEGEANRFASEILLPQTWIIDQIDLYNTPVECANQISRLAEVSLSAVCFKLISTIEPGYVFCLLDDSSNVLASGRSSDTLASPPPKGLKVEPTKLFPFAEKYWTSGNFHWWKMPLSVQQSVIVDAGSSNELLAVIIAGLKESGQDFTNFVSSINGTVGSANSQSKPQNAEQLTSAILQRLYSRSQTEERYKAFLQHPRLQEWLTKKSREVFSNSRSKT